MGYCAVFNHVPQGIFYKSLIIRHSSIKPIAMLLTTMNPVEINKQIHAEWARLWDTTVERLLQEYEKERKKFKIEKDRTYARDYHVKTKGKNTWIICIYKSIAKSKYEGQHSTSVCCAVYY
jgi:hypothetical protein